MTRAAAQEVMRDHLRASIRSGLLIAVDAGSFTARAVAAAFDPARLSEAMRARSDGAVFSAMRIIGAGAARSRGLRRGEVDDIDPVARAIGAALDQAGRPAGRGASHAILAMGGGAARSFAGFGAVRLPRGQVRQRDLELALGQCDPPPLARSRETIHAAPARFLVDGVDVDNPLDMEGGKIQVETHYVTVNRDSLRALLEAASRARIEPAGVVSTPYAAGLGCLMQDEIDLGAACVDMGAETTALALFRHGRLSHIDWVAVGGSHVSRDVAAALDLEVDEAERIKTLYGDAVSTAADNRQIASQLRDGSERSFARSMLIGVIRPRLEETLELVRSRLEGADFYQGPHRPVVLTGGAAQLAGCVETAKRILGRQIRLGRPVGLDGLPSIAAAPDFSAAVGLLAYAARADAELWAHAVLTRLESPSSASRAWTWLKNNW